MRFPRKTEWFTEQHNLNHNLMKSDWLIAVVYSVVYAYLFLYLGSYFLNSNKISFSNAYFIINERWKLFYFISKLIKSQIIIYKINLDIKVVYSLDKTFCLLWITAKCTQHGPRPQFIDRLITSLFVSWLICQYDFIRDRATVREVVQTQRNVYVDK